MATRYRFMACHAVNRTLLGDTMQLLDPSWSWSVGGSGSLSAKIALPQDDTNLERIKAATTPLVAAVYVKDKNGLYPWGGPIIKRARVPGSSQISITAMEWRAWLYNIMLLPGVLTDTFFSATPASGQEQLQLARDLLFAVIGDGGTGGTPPYTKDANVSAKARELNFYATQGKRVGELLDSMGNRDGGYEWNLIPRPDSVDGLPRLHFLLSYPERGGIVGGLKFKATSGGSNFKPDAIDEDYSSGYNQFLATGSGTPPDMLFAVDNAVLSNNTLLRMDSSASYNTVVDRLTLASHARKAIKFYQTGIQNIKGTHTFADIDPDSYAIGDRGSLLVEDRWDRIELPAVRVVEKTIILGGAGSVQFVLDLSDATLPEVDAGGVI